MGKYCPQIFLQKPTRTSKTTFFRVFFLNEMIAKIIPRLYFQYRSRYIFDCGVVIRLSAIFYKHVIAKVHVHLPSKYMWN